MTAKLESKVLTVPKGLIVDLANVQTAQEEDEESEVLPTWKEIDSELEELPTALCDVGHDLRVEPVYCAIDLDNELFCVDNSDFFNLWDIPRDRLLQPRTWVYS